MPKKQSKKSTLVLWIIIICPVLIIASLAYLTVNKPARNIDTPDVPEQLSVPVSPEPVIDYGQLNAETDTNALMKERKSDYGVDKGIDIIATPDESLKIGDTTVSMQDIIDQIEIESGHFVEKDLAEIETSGNGIAADSNIESYGIYVVQPGDNIWNIHFMFLNSYFSSRGITLSPVADEPGPHGVSSGVGKILKFSENMVHIYNIKERKLDTDINIIQPLSKIVVYNMKRIFDLLDTIDYKNIHQIRFDGETLWLPPEQ